MELTIDKKSLTDALTIAMPFVSGKQPVEIFKYCKCTTKGNRIKIEANNSNGGVIRYLNLISCDEDISFLLNCMDISKYLNKLSDTDLKIIVTDDVVTIKHRKGKATFAAPSVEDYPEMQTSDETSSVEIEIPSVFIASAVTVGKNFVSTEELRPQMKAIFAYVKDGKFGFCATDTLALVCDEYPIDIDVDCSFLIMPHVFPVVSTMRKISPVVKITIDEYHVIYRFDNTIVKSTVVKGKYPDFKRVIPQTHIACGNVDVEDLVDTVGRMVISADDMQCIKMSFDGMFLEVSMNNLTDVRTASERIACAYNGNPMSFGVNASMLLRSLRTLNAGDVRIELSGEGHPVLLKTDDAPNRTTLIMPMQLQN